jgi:hypothetical protein
MGDFWRAEDEDHQEMSLAAYGEPTDGSVRKQQITIRLDPGMIMDARTIAARKGIGHHTLLRMWVMEGITRAYQEGLLEEPPQSWAKAPRRALPQEPSSPAPSPTAPPLPDSPAPPAGARWARLRRQA